MRIFSVTDLDTGFINKDYSIKLSKEEVNHYSFVCLKNGLLKGYIFYNKNTQHIRFHSKSFSVLFYLFMRFIMSYSGNEFVFHSKTRLFNEINILHKFISNIRVEESFNDNVYTYKIHYIDKPMISNIKIATKNICYSCKIRESNYVKEVIDLLHELFPLDEIIRNKDMILNAIHSSNISYLNSLNNDSCIYVLNSMRFGQNTIQMNAFISKLEQVGYKRTNKKIVPFETNNYLKYNAFSSNLWNVFVTKQNIIYWISKKILNNEYDRNNFSYYRCLLRLIKRMKTYKYSNHVFLFDKTGNLLFDNSSLGYKIVPRNYNRVFSCHISDIQRVCLLKNKFPYHIFAHTDMEDYEYFLIHLKTITKHISVEDIFNIWNLYSHMELKNATNHMFNLMASLYSLIKNNLITNATLKYILNDITLLITESINRKEILLYDFYSAYRIINDRKIFRKYFKKVILSDMTYKEKQVSLVRDLYLHLKDNISDLLLRNEVEFYINKAYDIFNKHDNIELFQKFCEKVRLSHLSEYNNQDWFHKLKISYLLLEKFSDRNVVLYDFFDDYILNFTIGVAKKYGDDVSFKLFNYILYVYDLQKKSNNKNLLHDYMFPISSILDEEFIYAETLDKIFEEKFSLINKIIVILTKLNFDKTFLINNKDLFNKNIKNKLNKTISSLDLSEIENSISTINQNIHDRVLEIYKIDKNLTPLANEFLLRLQKYDKYITLKDLILFCDDNFNEIITGNYGGLFLRKEYTLKSKSLADLIIKILGKRGEGSICKNPFKVYNKLRKIGNPHSIVNGIVSREQTIEILSYLNTLNIQYDKTDFKEPFFKGVIEHKCSPEFLIAGNATVCCMDFYSDKLKIYALEKGFSVFNVYYNDRIIANSVIWIQEELNSLIIDNIEVHPNYTYYNKYIKELYQEMILNVKEDYQLDYVFQGCNYNDLILVDDNHKVNIKKNAKYVNGKNFYTDALTSWIVDCGSYNKNEFIKSIYPKLINK